MSYPCQRDHALEDAQANADRELLWRLAKAANGLLQGDDQAVDDAEKYIKQAEKRLRKKIDQ